MDLPDYVLRDIREDRLMTDAEWAVHLGVSPAAVRQIRQGRSEGAR